ncbi:hypothetical protein ACFQ9Y_15575 [Peribacillus simplex]
MNLAVLLVRLINILVNSDITREFSSFTREIGHFTREFGHYS